MDLREQKFGIEIEMTGISRDHAAKVLEEYLGIRRVYQGGTYETWVVVDQTNRKWKLMRDSSIDRQRLEQGERVEEPDSDYAVELVSPVCQYQDIPVIQEAVRRLRRAGAFVNESCGIHIHINAAPFSAAKLRNLVHIMAAKEDMIYRALQVDQQRASNYCKKMDRSFLEALDRQRPETLEEFKRVWYGGADRSRRHYDPSRYHCLNLHSVFQKGTIEFRAFNSSLHAGKIKAYIQFCLAITAQAYNQRYARPEPTVSENEKYTFRTCLLRMGLIGEEFKTARLHLLRHLEGDIAWKDPAQAQEQRERRQRQRALEAAEAQPEAEQAELDLPDTHSTQDPPEEPSFSGFTMSM